ncbi:hypothetical protein JL721_12273 [Aureococcus anophagefferens]|nr:hypothetical protein JL721_12273 [Aureococcus anophagefferens]
MFRFVRARTSSYCFRYSCASYEGYGGSRAYHLQKLEQRANDPALRPIRFLYEEFEPRCCMFIVYEILRRVFLTGCLVMFLPGSISQIAIGLLGTMISYRIYNYYRPYIEEDDNIISKSRRPAPASEYMEKNYLRYVSAWHCGVIASPRCNVAVDGEAGEVICGSVRDVVAWAPGTGERSRVFRDGEDAGGFASSPRDGPRGEVVCVAPGERSPPRRRRASSAAWRSADDAAQGGGVAFGPPRRAACAGAPSPRAATARTGDVHLRRRRDARAAPGHKAGVTDLCCLGDWAKDSGASS